MADAPCGRGPAGRRCPKPRTVRQPYRGANAVHDSGRYTLHPCPSAISSEAPLAAAVSRRRAGRRGLEREELVLGLAGNVVEHAMDRRRHVGVQHTEVKGDRLGARLGGLAGRQVGAQLVGVAELRDGAVEGAQQTLYRGVAAVAHDLEPQCRRLLGEDLGDVLPDAVVLLRLARTPSRFELDGQSGGVVAVAIEREIGQSALRSGAPAALGETVREPGRHLGGEGPRRRRRIGQQRRDKGKARLLLTDAALMALGREHHARPRRGGASEGVAVAVPEDVVGSPAEPFQPLVIDRPWRHVLSPRPMVGVQSIEWRGDFPVARHAAATPSCDLNAGRGVACPDNAGATGRRPQGSRPHRQNRRPTSTLLARPP